MPSSATSPNPASIWGMHVVSVQGYLVHAEPPPPPEITVGIGMSYCEADGTSLSPRKRSYRGNRENGCE